MDIVALVFVRIAFVPSIDSANYRTGQLLCWLASSVLRDGLGSIYKCFNDY